MNNGQFFSVAKVAKPWERPIRKYNRNHDPSVPPAHVVKIGRNDPCPCLSGKKYKKCHGK
jgi:uncharacterized protein YecA (UPF0149 family)